MQYVIVIQDAVQEHQLMFSDRSSAMSYVELLCRDGMELVDYLEDEEVDYFELKDRNGDTIYMTIMGEEK